MRLAFLLFLAALLLSPTSAAPPRGALAPDTAATHAAEGAGSADPSHAEAAAALPHHHQTEAAITDTEIVLPSGDPLGAGSVTAHKPAAPYR